MGARVWNTTAAVLVALLAVGCAGGIESTIDYSTARTERRARFLAHGDTLVVESNNPQGMNLVVEPEPWLDDGRVVLVAAVTSSGAAGRRRYCLDMARLSPLKSWPDHVFWRNPTNELVHVSPVDQGEAARRAVLDCRALHGTHSGLPSSRPSEP